MEIISLPFMALGAEILRWFTQQALNYQSCIFYQIIILKIYSPWQALQPIWDELPKSLENDKSVSISRINCEKYDSICKDFAIESYPTIWWIVDGESVEKYHGLRSVEAFQKYIPEHTGKEDGKE